MLGSSCGPVFIFVRRELKYEISLPLPPFSVAGAKNGNSRQSSASSDFEPYYGSMRRFAMGITASSALLLLAISRSVPVRPTLPPLFE
jgi:hypothetical protein